MIYLRLTRKTSKRKRVEQITFLIWLIFLGFCIGITPYFVLHEQIRRGCIAFGSEFFIPIVPFILAPAFDFVCNTIIKLKGWERK